MQLFQFFTATKNRPSYYRFKTNNSWKKVRFWTLLYGIRIVDSGIAMYYSLPPPFYLYHGVEVFKRPEGAALHLNAGLNWLSAAKHIFRSHRYFYTVASVDLIAWESWKHAFASCQELVLSAFILRFCVTLQDSLKQGYPVYDIQQDLQF